jgi:ribosome-binding factor A
LTRSRGSDARLLEAIAIMKSSQRLKRINQLIREELSDILRSEFPLDRMDLISVQEVRVTRDLKYAEVFINYLGTPQDRQRAVAFLTQRKGRVQQLLGGRIKLRETPHLKFVEDLAIDRGSRILEILQELEERDGVPSEGSEEGAPVDHPTDSDHP